MSLSFGLTPAPGGLRFVQDLVNTSLAVDDPARDLLTDLRTARDWLREALDAWAAATDSPAPLITLRPADLPEVQELRERVRSALRAEALNAPAPARPGGVPGGDVRLAVAPDGRMLYQPVATDARAITGLVAAETLLAQARGRWPALKACANPVCGACFYDASPNRSRVWHNTRTCGNTANLRASRGRRAS